MLRNVSEITGYTLLADDGEIGRCKDFLVEDEMWTIRYMVADTGKWLPGRKVLISPISLDVPIWKTKQFRVNLTKNKIENAPMLDEDSPVSRQYEQEVHNHYRYPPYWIGPSLWGHYPHPSQLRTVDPELARDWEKRDIIDSEAPNLRSINELTGYSLEAVDGPAGRIHDFIINDETWTIYYLVIDTGSLLLPGMKFLVAPGWIERIRWAEKTMRIDLSVERIKESPEYDPNIPINREYEQVLYDFHGRPHYWQG